jgi:SAM-dependent methyltransferase
MMAGQPQWQQLGGSAAEVYERYLVPAVFAPWAPLVIKAAGVRTGESVLDVACGTGVVARLAAERVGSAGRVVGLDLNGSMLAVARSLPPPPGAAIEWLEASALAMPLPSSSFVVVLCQHGLQQFTDRPSALAEIERVMRPGGRFAACVWAGIERSPGPAALAEALERHVGVAVASNRRAPFSFGDADELERLVSGARLRDVEVRTLAHTTRFSSPAKLVEYYLAGTPVTTLGTIAEEAVAAVVRDVSSALERYVSSDGLAVPMEAHVVAARKVD